MSETTCPKCHHQNETGVVTCRNCGAILSCPAKTKPDLPQVKIVDIDMPFMSMVNFMAKLALAAIPAAIIVAIIMVAMGGLFAGIFHR